MSTMPPSESDDSLFNERLRALYDATGEEAAAPPPPAGAWAKVEARLYPRGWYRRPILAGLSGLITGALLMGTWEEKMTHTTINQPDSTTIEQVKGATPRQKRGSTSVDVQANLPIALEAVEGSVATVATISAVSTPPLVESTRNLLAVVRSTGKVTGNLPTVANAYSPASVTSPASNPASSSASSSGTQAGTSTTGSQHVVTPPAVAVTIGTGHSVTGPSPLLLPFIQAEDTYITAVAADSSRGVQQAALQQELIALASLTRRADSLLLTLSEADAATAPVVIDSVPAIRRWSVLLAGAPERSFLGLRAPAADTTSALRRTHEQGRGGWNAALMAEYRLNNRWSVAAGAGISTTGAELRLTDRRTQVDVVYDTTTTTNRTIDEVTTRAYIINEVPEPHPSPIFNLSGQVVGYDTVWVPRNDTVWTVINSTLTTVQSNKTVTPVISRHEAVTARILRPSYRFLTIPLLVRYRFGRATDWTSSLAAPRWWADVAIGAQLQWFLGGTHLVTTDGGRTFQTERVGRQEAAFNPLNVAVTGQVAVNYALTSRFSASLAPTLRYQVESVYKSSTGLTQKPTATGIQLGLRYSF